MKERVLNFHSSQYMTQPLLPYLASTHPLIPVLRLLPDLATDDGDQ